MEAVDLGSLQELVVEKGKGSDWQLEKIIVKEPTFSGTETLFMAQIWLKDRKEGKKLTSVTLNATGQNYFRNILFIKRCVDNYIFFYYKWVIL